MVFVISVGILSMARYLHLVADRMTEPSASIVTALYFIVPHLELFNMNELIVQGWDARPLIYILLASLYGFAYTAFFLVAACLVFRRKALN